MSFQQKRQWIDYAEVMAKKIVMTPPTSAERASAILDSIIPPPLPYSFSRPCVTDTNITNAMPKISIDLTFNSYVSKHTDYEKCNYVLRHSLVNTPISTSGFVRFGEIMSFAICSRQFRQFNQERIIYSKAKDDAKNIIHGMIAIGVKIFVKITREFSEEDIYSSKRPIRKIMLDTYSMLCKNTETRYDPDGFRIVYTPCIFDKSPEHVRNEGVDRYVMCSFVARLNEVAIN